MSRSNRSAIRNTSQAAKPSNVFMARNVAMSRQ